MRYCRTNVSNDIGDKRDNTFHRADNNRNAYGFNPRKTSLYESLCVCSQKRSEVVLQGKLGTYFKEQTLLDQLFVKNPDITVGGLIDGAIQKFGERIEVARIARFSVLGR